MQANKYRNIKTVYNGITFDSRKECQRYVELSLMQRAGVIRDLRRQVSFELQPSFKNNKGEHIRAINYIADFTYDHGGVKCVEDVKSAITRKDKTYAIKKKMFMYKYPQYLFKES